MHSPQLAHLFAVATLVAILAVLVRGIWPLTLAVLAATGLQELHSLLLNGVDLPTAYVTYHLTVFAGVALSTILLCRLPRRAAKARAGPNETRTPPHHPHTPSQGERP